MPATIRIERRLDYYSYTFTSDDQCLLFFSRLYTSLTACTKAIAELSRLITDGRCVEKREAKGEYSFVVKDKRGELAGHSIVYFAASSRDYAIRKLGREAGSARVLPGAALVDYNTVPA